MAPSIDRERQRRLVLPVAVGAVLMWLTVALLALYAAWSGNAAMEERDSHLARTAVDSELDYLATFAFDYTWWDDAVRNLVLEPDDGWADENIGRYMFEDHAMDAAFVVERDGTPIMAFIQGKQSERQALDFLGDELFSFLRISDELSTTQPFAAKGLIRRGDAFYLVAASTFMGETLGNEMDVALGGRRAALVFVRELTTDILAKLSRRFQLDDLRFSDQARPEMSIPLADVDGKVMVHLEWDTEYFGHSFVRVVALPVAAAVIATGFFIVLFGRRVRELLEAQAETVQARERAEAATKARTDFLAMISHDIGAPLNGVLGLSSVLLTSKLTKDQRQMVEAINTSGQSLLDMIGDVVDYAKVEGGELAVEKGLFEVIPMIDNLLDAVSIPAWGKNLAVAGYVDPGLSAVSLAGDEARVRQVLLNLLNNAITHTDVGGLWVEAKMLPPPPSEEQGGGEAWVRFVVGDTGFGIAPDRQAHFFDDLELRSNRGKNRGTVLGLMLAHRLVHLMGGRIGVDSELGTGSTFWVELPLGVTGRPPQAVSLPLRLATALPDTAVGGVLRRQLEDWGIKAESLRGTSEVDATIVDAVLIDESCMEEAAWRELADSNRIPVLLLSDKSVVNGEEQGGTGKQVRVLRKPVRLSALLSALMTLGSGNQSAAQ